MEADLRYHFPPDLLELLVSTVPLLYKGKESLLLFFRGAGVSPDVYRDLSQRVKEDRQKINKFEIVRTILVRLSDMGNEPSAIRMRREIVKRVVEWEDYSTCYPDDVLKAKGLVAEVRRVRHVVDSFRKMEQEKDAEQKEHRAKVEAERAEVARTNAEYQKIKDGFCGLLAEKDANRRGKALEPVLNNLFAYYGILVRDAFTRQGPEGEGTVEQVDGVVDIDGTLYLVEMKWWAEPIGVPEMAQHINRLMLRGTQVRGIFISASGYTKPAMTTCRQLLSAGVVMGLCELKELYDLIERRADLKAFLKEKINTALIDQAPAA